MINTLIQQLYTWFKITCMLSSNTFSLQYNVFSSTVFYDSFKFVTNAHKAIFTIILVFYTEPYTFLRNSAFYTTLFWNSMYPIKFSMARFYHGNSVNNVIFALVYLDIAYRCIALSYLPRPHMALLQKALLVVCTWCLLSSRRHKL